jgi:hypothetical protein
LVIEAVPAAKRDLLLSIGAFAPIPVVHQRAAAVRRCERAADDQVDRRLVPGD